MSPVARKITYAVAFETLGILMGALVLRLFSGAPAEQTLALSVIGAAIALIWSYMFNSAFESWEARQTVRGRSFLRRAAHALLFEGGLTVILLPLTAWFLAVGLATALAYEIGLILFYLGYAWVFTWAFDRLFGLPASAC
ncbi:MAG: PACE efflux transporter [Proteobacteria bacterium]|nr:PACE efflux transporter [Pseudomonadota bacterium]MBS0572428.1 PACE efflux transporter [Pseudomonadota bacterium]